MILENATLVAVDWERIIRDLLDKGLRQAHIARRVGLAPSSIPDILLHRQESVRWEVGNALLQLHEEVCTVQK